MKTIRLEADPVDNEQRITLTPFLERIPQPALTADAALTVDDTYTTQERDMIQNHTTRINEIEARLRVLGFLK